jgi:hypothetical protein
MDAEDGSLETQKMGYNVREMAKGWGAEKSKNGANVGRPFARTPLLEETETRTGPLGLPFLPRRLPDQSQAGFFFSTLTMGYRHRGTLPGNQK